MTTLDQTTGRLAATRPRVALLCACLLAGVPALPAMAMQPAASASPAAATQAPAAGLPVAAAAAAAVSPAATLHAPALPAAPAVALPAPAAKAAAPKVEDAEVVLDDATMSDRALLLANDINRLMAKPSASAPTADAAAPATTGSRIQSVLQRALTLLGTPYRWGGTTTDGFDCSGLVGYVFRTTLGIELPRVSRDMARSGKEVDRGSLVPGDLVFFGRKGRVDHVGIYLGDNRFVHAPRTGRDVTVSKLDGYWGRKFLEARRVAGI